MVHPPVGFAMLLDDSGDDPRGDSRDDSVVRPIKGTGCHAEEEQKESPHPRVPVLLRAPGRPDDGGPIPRPTGPEEIPACAASSCPRP